eukprot:CAMPEP_0118922898 /NCGR_PEP_ID=MMETSP1169-20130426/1648_1 /TAXON_ID=36882 /ORGANISM="Pyramimonas obovata, Strain CCMP722" /LENGTH=970 /DNA_ID=CAMNT_0006863827 /DNA_START=188 /DNA_END=3100 /DNA_ORIENTATION=+
MGMFSLEKNESGQLLVQTDKGHYYPGDLVTGTVYFKVLERIRCNSILLKVSGKEVISPRDQKLTSSSDNVTVFLDESKTLHDVQDGDMQPGDYAFPFEYQLDDILTPSFDLREGHDVSARIVYAFETCLNMNGSLSKDLSSKQEVLVLPAPEQNATGYSPGRELKASGRNNTGEVYLKVVLSKAEYAQGEPLDLLFQFRNDSTVMVRNASVRLMQQLTLLNQTKVSCVKEIFSRPGDDVTPGSKYEQEMVVALNHDLEVSVQASSIKCNYWIEMNYDVSLAPNIPEHHEAKFLFDILGAPPTGQWGPSTDALMGHEIQTLVLALDKAAEVALWSDPARHLTGLPANKAERKPLPCASDEDAMLVKTAVRSAMAGKGPIPLRVTLALPDGGEADWPLIVSPHPSGAAGEVMVYRADIPGFGHKSIPGVLVQEWLARKELMRLRTKGLLDAAKVKNNMLEEEVRIQQQLQEIEQANKRMTEEHNEQLSEQIEEMKGRLSKSKSANQHLAGERDELEKSLSATCGKVDALAGEVEVLKNSEKTNAKTIKNLGNEKERLKGDLKEAEETNQRLLSENEEVHAEVKKAKHQVKKLALEKEELTNWLAEEKREAEEERRKLTTYNELLTSDVRKGKSAVKKLGKEKEELAAALAAAQARAEGDAPAVSCEEGLTLTRVDFDEHGAAAVFDKDGEPVVMGCDLLVTCDAPEVDPAVFYALNDASVVYDGRLVVDHEFRTNDPDIYSAGTLAKFSRRYANATLPMENYNSREVGTMLAESVIRRFLGAHMGAGVRARLEPGHAPSPALPKAVGTFLPGKMYGMYVALPPVFAEETAGGPKPHRFSPLTKSTEGHLEMHLDAQGLINAILYCGTRRIDIARLACIIGLPAAYLDNLPLKVQGSQVRDILDFIGSPWASALFHDKFPALRAMLVSELKQRQGDVKADNSSLALSNIVQCAVLKFVQQNASELVAYTVPEE